MRRQLAPDHEIARLATAQHGIVGRRQLIALGVSAQFVDRAVQRGRLQLVHRGVYAVGHRALTIESSDITKHRNIPITTPARTIIDLARTLEGRPLESALDRAEQRRLLDFAELHRRPIPCRLDM